MEYTLIFMYLSCLRTLWLHRKPQASNTNTSLLFIGTCQRPKINLGPGEGGAKSTTKNEGGSSKSPPPPGKLLFWWKLQKQAKLLKTHKLLHMVVIQAPLKQHTFHLFRLTGARQLPGEWVCTQTTLKCRYTHTYHITGRSGNVACLEGNSIHTSINTTSEGIVIVFGGKLSHDTLYIFLYWNSNRCNLHVLTT